MDRPTSLRISVQTTKFPISTLPQEVLAEIFLEYINSASLSNMQVALASLCLVCHFWKTTAYNIPRLWTNLSLVLQRIEGQHTSYMLLPWITQFFSRSGCLPLHLAIQGSRGAACRDIAGLYRLSPRISSLELRGILKFALSLVDNGPLHITWNWSSLETLKLYLPVHIWSKPAPTIFSAHSMPSLRSLDFEASFLQEWLEVLPWAQLVRLTIKTSSSETHVFNVLRRCHNLEECILAFPSSVQSSWRCEPVHLPKLQKLTLNLDFFDNEALLERLYLPSLESLDLRFIFPGAGIRQSALRSLTQSSNCNLRNLTLDGIQIDEEGYIDLLQGLPDIETLSIRTHEIRTGFLRHGLAHCTFLPRLRSLELMMRLVMCPLLKNAFDLFVDVRSKACSASPGVCPGPPRCGNGALLDSAYLRTYYIPVSFDAAWDHMLMPET